jgi:nucleotide-binding universal stress UspA family protein
MAEIIISYDGTPNDDDALALGRQLSRTGAKLALAYVRHSHEYDAGREELAAHDANRRLEQGASWLGEPEITKHVVVSASTGEGLAKLAESEGASLVVFGSDYRTRPGMAEPGTSAQHMLEGGSVAIAVAPAGLRTHPDVSLGSIAVYDVGADGAAQETAAALVSKLGATVVSTDDSNVDLVVVGSQAAASPGKIALGGATRQFLDSVRGAVLVVPQGRPVAF